MDAVIKLQCDLKFWFCPLVQQGFNVGFDGVEKYGDAVTATNSRVPEVDQSVVIQLPSTEDREGFLQNIQLKKSE